MPTPLSPLRLGLCCKFAEAPIKFRTTTAAALMCRTRGEQLEKLAELCRANAAALQQAILFCAEQAIGCFRITSQILPAKTHPVVGYGIDELPGSDTIVAEFRACRTLAAEHAIRLCFHPDQFVVLSSPRAEVVASSLGEIEYQAEVAEWVGADTINVHAGGSYGSKSTALATLCRNLDRLSARARERLTLENDDVTYTPADLLPVCRTAHVPLVYDVHHHRCLGDALTVEQATEEAIATWNREPLFHLSSPLEGWNGPRPRRHHDYIDIRDFPVEWLGLPITVEVEAKAKELAVRRLRAELDALAGWKQNECHFQSEDFARRQALGQESVAAKRRP